MTSRQKHEPLTLGLCAIGADEYRLSSFSSLLSFLSQHDGILLGNRIKFYL
jgi:hypothetical protein